MKRTSILGTLFFLTTSLVPRADCRPLYFGEEYLGAAAGNWTKADRFKNAQPQYRRDRDVDILHVKLEIAPDLDKQSFAASVTHRFKVLAADFDRLELDAKELEIHKVADEKGRSLDFEVTADKLVVHFPKRLPAGSEASVRIDYDAAPRHMGLHFFKADPRYPGQPDMVWSQGEADQNRYWIPLYDYPNERASTEIFATVPEGFTAVSNGKLISQEAGPKPGTTVFHWLQERPHVSYLMTLAVGRFAAIRYSAPVKDGEGAKEVPLTVWALPEQEGRARLTFGKTPAMVSYFSELLDTPYPWAKYDQILLYEFLGGMENTSATSILDRALLDKRASLDNDMDGLISHELAHQWFGDLITCKDWAHLWLNEGFASYFQAVWKAKDLGADEFAYDMYGKAQAYFGESGAYRRAVVTDKYATPDDMFDGHTYSKGAWVLQMLRKDLGEERFWRAFKRYIRDRKDAVAETEDLRRAVEETTGKSMVEFFSQWLYSPGYPSLVLKPEWDAVAGKLTLKLTQKQVKDGVGAFHFKLPLDLGGKKVTAEVSKEEETFAWDLSSRPRMISVDPDLTLLADFKLDFAEDQLLAGLKDDASVAGRMRAAKALAEKPNPKVVAGLRQCMLKDPFWGVAGACAAALGDIGGPQALAGLKDGVSVKHPKVRRAVAAALGNFLGQREALEALRPMAEKDESYQVEAAAVSSLGALRLSEARPLIEPKLQEDSWNEIIRKSALAGLGKLKDESLVPVLEEWAKPGKHIFVRQAALGALADAGEGKDSVRDFLATTMEGEDDRAIRGAAMSALTTLGDPKASSSLSRIAARDPDPSMRQRAGESVESIREGKKGKIEDLSKQVDQLSQKLERLGKQVDDLEKKKK